MILERATDDDYEYFFTLRTDPVASRMSRRRPPTRHEHLEWWKRTTDYRFVAKEEGVSVGTLRLSREGVVSIIVDPLFRGVGYGTKMLEALDPEAKALGITLMLAEIAYENEASQRAFLKSGWKPVLMEKHV